LREVEELKEIVRLASIHNDPSKFISAEEDMCKKSSKKSGAHFSWIGEKLFGAYPEHALASWKNASMYFVKEGDKMAELRCYVNQGIGYGKLGNFDAILDRLNRSIFPYYFCHHSMLPVNVIPERGHQIKPARLINLRRYLLHLDLLPYPQYNHNRSF
jgi:hypothetical protein